MVSDDPSREPHRHESIPHPTEPEQQIDFDDAPERETAFAAYLNKRWSEWSTIEDIFEDIVGVPSQPRVSTETFHIVIRWSILGINEPDETIAEGSAGRIHARFLSCLIKKYDPNLVEKVQQVHVVRKYSLSHEPKRDFVNRKTGKPYSAELVPDTDLWLCTATAKVDKRRGI